MPTYYEILGVPQTATKDQIHKSYMQLIRENHPDRFSDPAQRAAAEEKAMALNEAFNTLRDPKTRAAYDQMVTTAPQIQRKSPQEEARIYFNKGEGAEQIKDLTAAVECYRRACSLDPSMGKAFFRLAVIQGKNPNWLRQAVENYQKALALEPKAVEYYREYARCLMGAGMKLRAQKVAQQALALAPSDAELKSWAAQTASPAAAEKGSGLMGKFFKKG
jgi:curved DNA-binding protein CbpA